MRREETEHLGWGLLIPVRFFLSCLFLIFLKQFPLELKGFPSSLLPPELQHEIGLLDVCVLGEPYVALQLNVPCFCYHTLATKS